MTAVVAPATTVAPAPDLVDLGAWNRDPARDHERLWCDTERIGLGAVVVRWADLVEVTVTAEDHAGVLTHRIRLATDADVLELRRSSVRGYRKTEDRQAALSVIDHLRRHAPPHVVTRLPIPA